MYDDHENYDEEVEYEGFDYYDVVLDHRGKRIRKQKPHVGFDLRAKNENKTTQRTRS